MSAEAYVDHFLVGKFKPSTIIIGYDHRFGRDRSGDFHLLEDLRSKYGYTLLEIPVHVLHTVSVSSTRIREAVAKGDIEAANELLGYDYHFDGTVVEGNKLGRTLGFPTANLKITDDEKLLPGNGVYVAKALIRDPKNPDPQALLKGMMNVGFRPTVGGKNLTVEIHLFDFDQDLYRETLRVFVKLQLRPEKQFNGLDALKAQLEKDGMLAKYILNME
jgi:riboflavin kinase/FMN adenylyltransferase